MKRSFAMSLAVSVAPLLLLATQRPATAGDWFCGCTVFCRPKPPRIKHCCICPMRINPCCGLDNFGFYPACWSQWPFPRREEHCPCPPPFVPDVPKTAKASEELPSPSKAETDMEAEKPGDAKDEKDKKPGDAKDKDEKDKNPPMELK